MNLNDLISKIIAFRDARDWKQFHKANHLAAAIAIEAAELSNRTEKTARIAFRMDYCCARTCTGYLIRDTSQSRLTFESR
jgi:hypothetical protein